mgnify:CR=1 FL=1
MLKTLKIHQSLIVELLKNVVMIFKPYKKLG